MADDLSVRVVLLTGAGRNFCVGGDLRSFAGAEQLGTHLRDVTTPLHAAIALLARLDAPVVAAVQGSAAGAGMSLAAGADLVVCAESARFVRRLQPRRAESRTAGGRGTSRASLACTAALELALTNRVLTVSEAVAWGLATRVVPDDELAVAAEALAAELRPCPSRALAARQRLLRGSLDTALDAAARPTSKPPSSPTPTATASRASPRSSRSAPPSFGEEPLRVTYFDLDAVTVADGVRSGASPRATSLDESLERIERLTSRSTPSCSSTPHRARAAAADVDRRVKAGRDPVPLAGVPLGIKELESSPAGPTRGPLPCCRDRVATRTSTMSTPPARGRARCRSGSRRRPRRACCSSRPRCCTAPPATRGTSIARRAARAAAPAPPSRRAGQPRHRQRHGRFDPPPRRVVAASSA